MNVNFLRPELLHPRADPYLNTDAGTMSPFEHGEVFVLDDGGEADLDLGIYERFLDLTLKKDNNITTGKIYQVCSATSPQSISLHFRRPSAVVAIQSGMAGIDV